MTQRDVEKGLFLAYLVLAGVIAVVFYSQLDHYDPLVEEIGLSLMAFLGVLIALGFSHCIVRWIIAVWRRRMRIRQTQGGKGKKGKGMSERGRQRE